MKLDLIKKETAILAHEKGFNIRCKEAYFETKEHTLDMGRGGDCTFPYHAPRILRRNSEDEFTHFIAEAPEQGLLQRWLREVHDIQVYVHPYSLNQNHKMVGGNGFYEVVVDKLATTWSGYKTYEEALEVGLFEGLQLISSI